MKTFINYLILMKMNRNYIATIVASTLLLMSSCQDDNINSGSQGEGVTFEKGQMITLNVGAAVVEDNTDTKVALNTYGQGGVYWSNDDALTAIDMTLGYYNQEQNYGKSKAYDLKTSSNVGTGNTAEFRGEFPVTGLDVNDPTIATLNFIGVLPSLQWLEDKTADTNFNPAGIPFDRMMTLGNLQNGDQPKLDVIFPDRLFYIVNGEHNNKQDAFHKYGMFLPHISLPIQDIRIKANDDNTTSIIDELGNVIEGAEVPSFEFMHLYHVVMIHIMPDIYNAALMAVQSGSVEARVTLLDQDNNFVKSESLDLNSIIKATSQHGSLTSARIVQPSNEEFKSITARTQYVDWNGDIMMVTPKDRQYDIYDYLAIPIITPATTGDVVRFEVEILFRDNSTYEAQLAAGETIDYSVPSGDIVMRVYKQFVDLTPDSWRYGGIARIDLGMEDFDEIYVP